MAPVAQLTEPVPRSCPLQIAGSSGPQKEPLSLPVSLEGRAQDCARMAAWRDRNVSIVLGHTDITGTLDAAAHTADPQLGRRSHWGPCHLYQHQRTPSVSEISRVCTVVSGSLPWPVRDTSNMGTYPPALGAHTALPRLPAEGSGLHPPPCSRAQPDGSESLQWKLMESDCPHTSFQP